MADVWAAEDDVSMLTAQQVTEVSADETGEINPAVPETDIPEVPEEASEEPENGGEEAAAGTDSTYEPNEKGRHGA